MEILTNYEFRTAPNDGTAPCPGVDRKRQLFFKELVGTTATGTQGLGSGAKREQPTERKQMSGMIREFDEQSMLVSLYDKASQGRFLTWENAMSLDTGWSNLLYKLSPDLLKFHVNAINNTVASLAWNIFGTFA